MNTEKADYLYKMYFTPENPGSFQSPYKLFRLTKEEDRYNFTLAEIENWIKQQESYSLNRNVRRNFQRSRVIVSGIDDQFDADLASLMDYATENNGFKYLLCVIDIFTRFAWVVAIKNKTAPVIVEAFKTVFKSRRIPKRLRTDAAKDFTSREFQRYIAMQDVSHFTTHNEKQANYVERFIQTIKQKIFRYMTEMNTRRYIDVLPKLVSSYNSTWHSGIKEVPMKVTKADERELWWQQYWPGHTFNPRRHYRRKPVHFKLNIGDTVRISYTATAFDRQYSMKWSGEIFKISQRYVRQKQPVYKVIDWFDEPIQGTFYEDELQKITVDRDKAFKIDKIIRFKGRGKNKSALVHWKGWPKKFDSWEPASNIKDL